MQLPIEEYFKYHPPTTPERIALHDRVNRESLEICNALIEIDVAILLSHGIWKAGIALGEGEVDFESSGDDPIAALSNLRAQVQGLEKYNDFTDRYQNGLERVRINTLDRVDQFNRLKAGDLIKRWDSDANDFLTLQVYRASETTEHQAKSIEVLMPNLHTIDRNEYVLGEWDRGEED